MENSPRKSLFKKTLIRWGLRAILVVVLVGAWTYANYFGGVSKLILPEFWKVLVRFFELLFEPWVWVGAGITIFEMIVGFALAAALGLLLGFIVSRYNVLSRATEPLLAWGYMFPIVLLYPLFLLWVGVGIESKIWYAAVGAFFPIAYNTIRGLRSVDERYLKVGKAFGASQLQVDFQIKAGAARPMILSGLRIGVSIVTISVVLAELLGSNAGLGHLIESASSRFNIIDVYGLVFVLVLVAVAMLTTMERLMRQRD